MQIIRVPSWGLDYCGAEYYGRRHSLHIGPFLIFWGQMSEDEIAAWDDARQARWAGTSSKWPATNTKEPKQ